MSKPDALRVFFDLPTWLGPSHVQVNGQVNKNKKIARVSSLVG